MEIEWSSLAQKSLSNIAQYLSTYFGKATVERTLHSIVSFVGGLANKPYIGNASEDWCTYGDIRCAVYKCNQIFYIVKENKIIVIVVWDSRQNPRRLKQIVTTFLKATR